MIALLCFIGSFISSHMQLGVGQRRVTIGTFFESKGLWYQALISAMLCVVLN